jgi:type VI secretion system protein ImpL
MPRRTLIIAIALLALYLVLAWLGSLMLAPEGTGVLAAVLLSALGITIFVVWWLVSSLKRQQTGPVQTAPNQASAAETATVPLPAAKASGPDPEVDAITALIAEANRQLAQSPALASRRVSTSVTALPFYLMIGPEGSGKTSTFLNAGLNPVLLAGQTGSEGAILPTRLANFWYANDAAFIEIAGQFFSQDASRFARLLSHLKGGAAQFRGVILVLEASAFVGVPEPNRLNALARRAQEKLRVIGEAFGRGFPVWTILSKGDSAPYFGEYFSRLTESEDQQILGCTVPLRTFIDRPSTEVFAESETVRLNEAFAVLLNSLAEKRITFLAREPMKPPKPFVYEFPREMKRLRDPLVQFLVEVFRPNPLQPSPLLRGFYFTGVRKVTASGLGLEAGSPSAARVSGEATKLFDLEEYKRKIGLTGEAAGLSGERQVSRWGFVSELFHQVIVPDRSGAATVFRNRRQELLWRIAYGSAAALALILSLCFIRSWWLNRELVSEIETTARKPFTANPGANAYPSLDSLRALDELRGHLVQLLEWDEKGAPWKMGFGLHAGDGVLESTQDLYLQRFRRVFYDDVQRKLDSTLMGLPGQPDGAYPYASTYDQLKLYRMITSRKCTPEKEPVVRGMLASWSRGRSMELDAERQVLAERQVAFFADLLKKRQPYRVDEQRGSVERGQQYLAGFTGADRVYRAIVMEADTKVKAARLADLAPDFASVLTGPGQVSGAFSRDGQKVVDAAIKAGGSGSVETCVLGGIPGAQFVRNAQLEGELRGLYVNDYIRIWKLFLEQTHVAPYGSRAVAAQRLDKLADVRSPLLAALFMTAENTNFPASPSAAATPPPAEAAAGNLLDNLLKRAPPAARKLKDAAAAQLAPPPPAATLGDITAVFQPARESAAPSRDRFIGPNNSAYVDALSRMRRAMADLVDDRASNPDAGRHQEAKAAVEAGFDQVRQIAQRFNLDQSRGVDKEVARLLREPFERCQGLYIGNPANISIDLEKKDAGGGGARFCAALRPLLAKFPFNSQADAEVTLDEFSKVFAPQNSEYALLVKSMSKFAVKVGDEWTQNPESKDVTLSSEFLRFMTAAGRISDRFFADGGSQPRVRYTLRPVANNVVKGVELQIDGDRLSGRDQSKVFTWPGPGGARLDVRHSGTTNFGSYNGVWAVFRLMADGTRAGGGILFDKTRAGRGNAEPVFDEQNRPVTLTLQVSGADPFGALFGLRCPGRITQ